MWMKRIYSVWQNWGRGLYIFCFHTVFKVTAQQTLKVPKRQFHLRFWHRQRLCFGLFDAHQTHQDSMSSSLTSTLIHIKQVQTTKEFDNTLPMCYHSPLHYMQVSIHLDELWCSSFIANLCLFSQILFKQVSFQSALSAWETLGRLNSCSCGSKSEQLSHSQKGFRPTGHHWDKILARTGAEIHHLWHTDSTKPLTTPWV